MVLPTYIDDIHFTFLCYIAVTDKPAPLQGNNTFILRHKMSKKMIFA